jgi:hypothetical protein
VMVAGKMEEPFVIYTSLPRSPVRFSELSLQDVDVHGRLLVAEYDVDADFTSFYRNLVCCHFK